MAKIVCQKIPVNLANRSYTISIAPKSLDQLELIGDLLEKYSHAFIVTDANVGKLYLAKLKRRLKKHLEQIDSTVCPAGERAKVMEIAYSIWQKMVGAECDRKTLLIALGGGVVGDLAGFVAATFMRGVDLLQIPTTLLAQVDSSVGGKTGINLPQGKNLVGAFWQPKGVLIDPEVLATLPDREYRAGLAEVVKYGVILSAEFFEFLEQQTEAIQQRDSQVLSHIIAECCRLKASVVVEDEFETTGHRARLNFGHTYGHAFEFLLGYGELLHGEAVAIGMCCAALLAQHTSGFSNAETERIQLLLQTLGLPTKVPAGLPASEIIRAMQCDKKKVNKSVQLVLPSAIGNVTLVAWPGDEQVASALTNR